MGRGTGSQGSTGFGAPGGAPGGVPAQLPQLGGASPQAQMEMFGAQHPGLMQRLQGGIPPWLEQYRSSPMGARFQSSRMPVTTGQSLAGAQAPQSGEVTPPAGDNTGQAPPPPTANTEPGLSRSAEIAKLLRGRYG